MRTEAKNLDGFAYRRRCTKCGQHRLMAGGGCSSQGKNWRCADCRPKPKAEEARK